MDPYDFDQMKAKLMEKRQQVSDFIETTPPDQKEKFLGPAKDNALETHLQVLDDAIYEAEEKTLGSCVVCQGFIEEELLEADYTSHVCLTHLSEDEQRSLEYELELSQTVQKAFLPQQAPAFPGLEVAVFNQPAQIVSGDFYDFFQFGDDSFGLAIADVAGHGVSSGLIVASLQTALRTLAPMYTDPAALVDHLNRFFIHNLNFTTFVTLFVGRLVLAQNQLAFTNAGHNPPLLHRAHLTTGDHLTWLNPTGPAIGLVENAQYRSGSVEISAGDLLILYTDGVTETTNPALELFGQDRLAQVICRQAGLPVRELVQTIRSELFTFSGESPLADDTTIVVNRFSTERV